ncbi:MAG: AAA family ATPase, partial [Beijerinckiaceae bacterium]
AKHLAARLIDNHTLLNPVEALLERSDAAWRPMRADIRSLVMDYARRGATHSHLIFTEALADEANDRKLFADFVALADARKNVVIPVVLDCSLEENLRRLQMPERAALLKLTKADILSGMRSQYELLRPDEPLRIDMDVSDLTAENAAAAIYERIDEILKRAAPE